MKNTCQKSLAYLLLRLIIGINFLGHGLIRLPKIDGFRTWMVDTFAPSLLPSSLVYAWGTVLPVLEFSIGLLLILGLFTRLAAFAGGLVIVALIFGSCMLEKWEWAGGQMIYGFFFFLVLHFHEHNSCSLDKKYCKKS